LNYSTGVAAMKFKHIIASVFLIFTSHVTSALTVINEEDIDTNDIVYLDTDVEKSSVDKVVIAIHTLQSVNKTKPIYFLIDSHGGEIVEGMRIVDAMNVSKRPVYTVVAGTADSMGAMIHAHGVKRYMLPNSEIMYHLASQVFSGDIVRTRSRLERTEYIVAKENIYISSRSNITVAELEQMQMKEWWIGADEALKRNIIDDTIASTAFVFDSKKEDKKESKPKFPFLPLP
jgi:ATP-dependent Clp endopeptidase proteolytic subunit ClpP